MKSTKKGELLRCCCYLKERRSGCSGFIISWKRWQLLYGHTAMNAAAQSADFGLSAFGKPLNGTAFTFSVKGALLWSGAPSWWIQVKGEENAGGFVRVLHLRTLWRYPLEYIILEKEADTFTLFPVLSYLWCTSGYFLLFLKYMTHISAITFADLIKTLFLFFSAVCLTSRVCGSCSLCK